MLDRLIVAVDAGLGQGPAGVAPHPWLGWLMVALLRQRVRQRWHRSVVQSLSTDDGDGGDDGDDGDREVPGLPGWTAYFHGIGCCLTGPDGEILDVDQRDDAAAVIDPWFFATRVESLRERGPVEKQVWRWLPSRGLIVAGCAELRDGGALVPFEGDHLFRLVDALERRSTPVAAEDLADPATAARWSSALGAAETPALTVAHHAWLLALIAAGGSRAYDALEGAAAILSDAELTEACMRVIDGPIGSATAKAIEVLRGRRHPRADGAIQTLLDRLSPTRDPPAPAYQALAYLLEQSSDRTEVALFQRFAGVERAAGFGGNPFTGSYAALALRFLPEQAMDLVRRALRSTTPMCVSEMAALLAAIDQPWCHRELASALDGPPTTSARSYLVEALRRCTGELASARARASDRPPPETPGQIGFTLEQVLYNSVRGLFEPELAKAMPLAAELRSRYPPDWDG